MPFVTLGRWVHRETPKRQFRTKKAEAIVFTLTVLYLLSITLCMLFPAGAQPLEHYRHPLGNTDSLMITIYCFHWCQGVNFFHEFMSTSSRFKVEFPSYNGPVMSCARQTDI